MRLSSFADHNEAVWERTGCTLPREVYAEFRDNPDPEARLGFMCSAAIATAECEWEMLIENRIDGYLDSLETDATGDGRIPVPVASAGPGRARGRRG